MLADGTRLGSAARHRIAGLRRRFGQDIEHLVAPGVSLVLPADHGLPRFHALHRHYDRFLPHLAGFLPPGTGVVDVGANCGDTLAAMHAANQKLAFTCIEPAPVFDAYLRRNLARLRAAHPMLDVTIVNAMVGAAVSGAALVEAGGTAKQVVGGASTIAGAATLSLDAIMAGGPPIGLLKSDVDGFDYDVLDSASAVIAADRPLLFFECQLDHAFQRDGYRATIAGLVRNGYRHWTVFDNFGEVLLRTSDIDQIGLLLDYLWRQNAHGATRTIFYYDMLAATDGDAALVDRTVTAYLET